MVGAGRGEGAILEHAPQARLDVQGQRVDAAQQERASLSLGECAPGVGMQGRQPAAPGADQHGREPLGGQRPAVHRDQGAVSATPQRVHGGGQLVGADAVLAVEQERGVQLGKDRQPLLEQLDRGRVHCTFRADGRRGRVPEGSAGGLTGFGTART